jgi:protein ImuB
MAEAKAMLRCTIHVEPHCPRDDQRDLKRLGRWAYRFVPLVAVDGADGLLLDARGCAHLSGGIDRLVDRIMRRLTRAAITARIAAAPTFGSAWALARYAPGSSPVLVESGGLNTALDGLPLAALRIDNISIDALRAVGVERIGPLRALPRAALASRYSRDVLLRLDQAFGLAIETFTPIRPVWPMCVEHQFDGPTDRLEAITLATRTLVQQLAQVLRKRHKGSLSLRAELIRSDMEPLLIPVRTSSPCSDAAHLWTLLAPKIERAHLGFGVEGVRLTVLCSARSKSQQAECWPSHPRHTAEVARLLDTLYARLGTDRVVRPVAVESHLPERAFAFASVLEPRNRRAAPVSLPPLDRPTLVRASPVRIEVQLLAPDGPLIALRSRGLSIRVLTCTGPERLAGEWWHHAGPGVQRAAGCRDYFKVHTDDGRWLWVYRHHIGGGHTPEWFLHGEWA